MSPARPPHCAWSPQHTAGIQPGFRAGSRESPLLGQSAPCGEPGAHRNGSSHRGRRGAPRSPPPARTRPRQPLETVSQSIRGLGVVKGASAQPAPRYAPNGRITVHHQPGILFRDAAALTVSSRGVPGYQRWSHTCSEGEYECITAPFVCLHFAYHYLGRPTLRPNSHIQPEAVIDVTQT